MTTTETIPFEPDTQAPSQKVVGYAELQRRKKAKTPPKCSVCNSVSTTSTKHGARHVCECGLVSWDYKPLTTPQTMLERRVAHLWFDLVWKKPPEGLGLEASRNKAYKWFQGVSGLDADHAHMSVLNDDGLKSIIEASRERVKAADEQAFGLAEAEERAIRSGPGLESFSLSDARAKAEKAIGLPSISLHTADSTEPLRVIDTRTKRMPNAPCPPGVYRDMPEDEYHAMDAINASTLKHFVRSGHHGALYLDGENGPPSPEILFGTALHARILEPERFAADAINGVYMDGKSKGKPLAHGVAYSSHKKAQDANPGKIILHDGWDEQIEGIARMISDHPKASALLNDPDVCRELTLVWTERVDLGDGTVVEFLCKARIDLFNPAAGLVPDIKTTNATNLDPRSWQRHAYSKMRYHMSMGWYFRGLLKCGLLDAPPKRASAYMALLIACVTEAPYMVQVHGLTRADVEAGFARLWLEALPRYLKYRIHGHKAPMAYHDLVSDNDGNPKTITSDDILPCHTPAWEQPSRIVHLDIEGA